jgi:hypothetical protein
LDAEIIEAGLQMSYNLCNLPKQITTVNSKIEKYTYFADGTTHNDPTYLLNMSYDGNGISAGGANLPHVWVQSGQPSAKQTGDIWFKT